MSIGIILYLIVGLIWVKLEDELFDLDFSEFSSKEIVFCILQQLIHYIRIDLTWPLYALEDLLIWLSQSVNED